MLSQEVNQTNRTYLLIEGRISGLKSHYPPSKGCSSGVRMGTVQISQINFLSSVGQKGTFYSCLIILACLLIDLFAEHFIPRTVDHSWRKVLFIKSVHKTALLLDVSHDLNQINANPCPPTYSSQS